MNPVYTSPRANRRLALDTPIATESDPASELVATLAPSALHESFGAASLDARFAMAVAAIPSRSRTAIWGARCFGRAGLLRPARPRQCCF